MNLDLDYINNIIHIDIKMITALTINYNTPDLLEKLLISFRQFYDTPYVVIDGSNKENYEKIKDFTDKFNIELIHFDYNIHHGPGMAHGFNHIKTEQILLLDSDVFILKNGFVEDLQSKLRGDSYGIGDISIIDERGVNTKEGIKYLHPSCALINREIALQYALPIKHGAPMVETMKDIHNKKADILQHEPWVANDLVHSLYERDNHKNNIYIVHVWSGTCGRMGGMNL